VKSTCNLDDNRYLREDASNLAAYFVLAEIEAHHGMPRATCRMALVRPITDDTDIRDTLDHTIDAVFG